MPIRLAALSLIPATGIPPSLAYSYHYRSAEKILQGARVSLASQLALVLLCVYSTMNYRYGYMEGVSYALHGKILGCV